MSHQALYRKYRPQSFDALIGQTHITTILKNQVRDGQLSHAYLFTGTRGTGKTTAARIFARAVNCLAPRDGEPCEECEACRISAGENADIVEMDAASNSNVEAIRALVERARYTPLQLKYKVYIIDEAHALAASGQAFNALLKTLEEPPPHVIFILATTEPQKLPATIRSRCQRLDFHRLRIADMVGLLEDILQKSGAHIDAEGLHTIARAADGGMRDALSLTDQCLSFCGNSVSAQDVYAVLGSMDGEFFFAMAEALKRGDARAALALLDKLLREGRDLTVFARDMTLHMRALLVSKLCGASAELLDCTEEDAQRYVAQCAAMGEARLLRAVEQLSLLQGELRYLDLPRPRVESTLLRIAQPEEAATLCDLQARIEALEEKLANGVQPQVLTPAPPAPALSQAEAPPWDTPASTSAPAAPPAKSTASAAPAAEAPQAEATSWEGALQKLRSTNAALYALLLRAKASTEEGVTVLRYDKDAFTQAVRKYQSELEPLLGRIRVETIASGPSPEDNARALFGDALRVTD